MADASQSWSQTIDNLFTTTWMKRVPSAELQSFLKTPFIDWLYKKNKVKKQAGYTRIEIPLEYGSNTSTRWIGKGGTIPIKDEALVTMAFEDWKYVATGITRFGTDDQKNRGKAKLLDYMKIKLGAAERSLNENFEAVFFGDGTGADEPNGIQNLISATPTTGIVHGINRATAANAYFRNQQKTSSGAASVHLLNDMRNFYNTCTKFAKSERGDYVFYTDQTTYELYEEEVEEQKRIVNQDKGDPFFDSISFKGRPLYWAPSAPSGNIYFLNTNYFYLWCDTDYWMQMTDWKSIPDQVNDKVAQILCTCNLICSRPVVQGVLTANAA